MQPSLGMFGATIMAGDKRRQERLRQTHGIIVATHEENHRCHAVKLLRSTTNVSADGLQFENVSPLPCGSSVEVQLVTEPSGDLLARRGTVRWSAQRSCSNDSAINLPFVVGVELHREVNGAQSSWRSYIAVGTDTPAASES